MLPYNPNLKSRARELRNAATPAEKEMWDILREHFKDRHFMRQKPIGYFVADFYCSKAKLIIEIDGGIHNVNNNKERDKDRTDYFSKYNLQVTRFTNDEVLKNKGLVLERLKEIL
jgi:very-short-patch-repair endonuclease